MSKLRDSGFMSLEEIKKNYGIDEHKELVELIERLCYEGRISYIENSPLTAQYKRIHTKYRIVKNNKDEEDKILEEINFTYHPIIQIDSYRNNIKKYEEVRDKLKKLNAFFIKHTSDKLLEVSINERSYEIFQNEKFLASSEGESLLNTVGIDGVKDLVVYRTPEPFIYLSINRKPGQNVLIVENKDTYITLCKMLRSGESILGEDISTIIYGEGKKVISSIPQLPYDNTLVYLLDKDNTYFYWGDIDRSGFAILSLLKSITKEIEELEIVPFEKAYKAMVDKLLNMNLEPTFSLKEQNEKYSGGIDLLVNSKLKEYIKSLLDEKLYIPQEILNRYDLRRG